MNTGKVITASYEKPDWSSAPIYDYSLETIKNGVIVGEIPLKQKEYFLLGRQGDVVDILLEHESISRKHAVLNFHNDGSLYLKDLGSAQGTVINKKICEKNQFYKLNVGDVIKFGCSTRIYVVKGPQDFQSEEIETQELRQLREKAIQRAEKLKEAKAKQADDVTWGMDFDDYDETSTEDQRDENNDRFSNSKQNKDDPKRSFLPDYLRKDENYDRKYGDKYIANITNDEIHNDKDEKILEKIRKKETKIQNMQEEIRRIYVKESQQDDGLTTGQLQVIERNDKAIIQLQQEIDQLIHTIRDKNQIRQLNKDGGGKKRDRNDLDDDDDRDDDGDDVMDTSHQTTDVSTNWRLKKKLQKIQHTIKATVNHSTSTNQTTSSTALDYNQIKQEVTDVQDRLSNLDQKLQQLEQAQQKAEEKEKNSEAIDEVDRIIEQDVQQEIKLKIKTFTQEKLEYSLKLQHLEKLLKIVTPAVKSLVDKADTATTVTSQKAKDESAKEREISEKNPIKGDERRRNVPKFSDDSGSTDQMMSFEEFQKSIEQEKEAEKQREETEKANSTLNTSSPSPANQSSSTVKKAVKGPAMPAPTTSSETKKVVGAPAQPVKSAPLDPNMLEGGDYVWVPPKKQKGDGKTSLNEKFGY